MTRDFMHMAQEKLIRRTCLSARRLDLSESELREYLLPLIKGKTLEK